MAAPHWRKVTRLRKSDPPFAVVSELRFGVQAAPKTRFTFKTTVNFESSRVINLHFVYQITYQKPKRIVTTDKGGLGTDVAAAATLRGAPGAGGQVRGNDERRYQVARERSAARSAGRRSPREVHPVRRGVGPGGACREKENPPFFADGRTERAPSCPRRPRGAAAARAVGGKKSVAARWRQTSAVAAAAVPRYAFVTVAFPDDHAPADTSTRTTAIRGKGGTIHVHPAKPKFTSDSAWSARGSTRDVRGCARGG